nr:NAD(P)/FAD-dependent oxidoreductase [Gellertiella hungarica]
MDGKGAEVAARVDVLVLGAGAAGLMAAIRAGQRGRRVLVVDHASKPAEKIRISGGGRCNFTNIHAGPKAYLSQNPHFAKSALARYTPQHFIDLVDRHRIAWHEKTLGQLFCDNSATDIIRMLLDELKAAGGELRLGTEIGEIALTESGFRVGLGSEGEVQAQSLIVATGGKSIPKMGATGFAYQIAAQFGLPMVETRPGLVPLTLEPMLLERLSPLSGVSVSASVSHGKTAFREAVLFTHRGLSGPAILQISSYWREGDRITLSLEPDLDLFAALKAAKATRGKQALQTVLADHYPKRLAQHVSDVLGVDRPLADLSDKALQKAALALQSWEIVPGGSEGYRTAEVTVGGIDTRALDSRTMQARDVPGLYFVGECVDVTGWLGGYNFQWAWASGHAAGEAA